MTKLQVAAALVGPGVGPLPPPLVAEITSAHPPLAREPTSGASSCYHLVSVSWSVDAESPFTCMAPFDRALENALLVSPFLKLFFIQSCPHSG